MHFSRGSPETSINLQPSTERNEMLVVYYIWPSLQSQRLEGGKQKILLLLFVFLMMEFPLYLTGSIHRAVQSTQDLTDYDDDDNT